jgi:hypothetical protein
LAEIATDHAQHPERASRQAIEAGLIRTSQELQIPQLLPIRRCNFLNQIVSVIASRHSPHV